MPPSKEKTMTIFKYINEYIVLLGDLEFRDTHRLVAMQKASSAFNKTDMGCEEPALYHNLGN